MKMKEKQIMNYILTKCERNNGQWCEATTSIAKKFNSSRMTAHRAISSLVDLGLIIVSKRKIKGLKWEVSVYTRSYFVDF